MQKTAKKSHIELQQNPHQMVLDVPHDQQISFQLQQSNKQQKEIDRHSCKHLLKSFWQKKWKLTYLYSVTRADKNQLWDPINDMQLLIDDGKSHEKNVALY